MPLLKVLPNVCPRSFPCTLETQDGNPYFKLCPCNNGKACKTCRSNRIDWQLQKIKDGLQRSAKWSEARLRKHDGDYANQLRTLLARLNAPGLWYFSIEIGVERIFIHEPVRGVHKSSTRGRRKTLLAAGRYLRQAATSVRFARASSTRPCWTKNTAQRRQQFVRRNPSEKHRHVVASQLGPQRFQKLCVDVIGRKLNDGDKLAWSEVDAMFGKSFRSESAVGIGCSHTARLIQSEREERRLERESWRESRGPDG